MRATHVRKHEDDDLPPFLHVARTVLLFLGGMAGIAYETVAEGTDRPTLLLLFAAMIGLPFVVRADQKSRPSEDERPRERDT
jgi:hypothetical protein